MWKKQETTESPEARLLFSPGFLVQTSDGATAFYF